MKFTPREQSKLSYILKRLSISTAVFVVSLILICTFSKTAHASLLSFVSSIFGSEQASAEVPSQSSGANSQTIVLLSAAANVDPNPDKPTDVVPVDGGGEILIPDLAGLNVGTDDGRAQITTYVVQPDDNLSSIADMFGISVNTIKQANNLSGSTIQPGKTLTILPVDGMLYTVQSGDTVGSIARRFGATKDDILTYNSLTATTPIAKGQQLVIPHGSVPVSQAKTYIATTRKIAPSFEPLLDPVWQWVTAPAGYYACPVPGAVLTQGLHGHNAVDLAIGVGTPIYASAAGTVTISKSNGLWNGAYGNFVMISHNNGSQTLYAHMKKAIVSVGESVAQDEVIGYVGMTGMTTGPHVHFEIRGATNPFASVTCR